MLHRLVGHHVAIELSFDRIPNQRQVVDREPNLVDLRMRIQQLRFDQSFRCDDLKQADNQTLRVAPGSRFFAIV